MSKAIDAYLDQVMAYANRRDEEALRIRAEQHDHLMEKFERLKKQGVPAEDAVFEAIQEHGDARIVGYRLRPRFPLVDIRTYGTARGVVAIGPRAVGVFAFGGAAVGLVAFGGFAAGLLSLGGVALGLIFVWGGMALGGLSYGGLAIGLVAFGGCAIGAIACGGLAAGLWVPLACRGQVHRYFTIETVPDWMRQLDLLIVSPQFYSKLLAIIMPILMLSIILPTWLQWRESKRTLMTASLIPVLALAFTLSMLVCPLNAAEHGEWARLSPFTRVQVVGDTARVEFAGTTYELLSIEGFTTEQMLSFCRETYGTLAEKRFVEDLVEVMIGMGKEPGKTVALVLREPQTDRTISVDRALLTHENRRAVYMNRYERPQRSAR